MANTLAYLLDGKIYINLTNMCTNDCIFCLRNDKDDVVGQTLWLDSENSTANDVIEQFEKHCEGTTISVKKYEPDCTFCGSSKNVVEYKGKIVCEKSFR